MKALKACNKMRANKEMKTRKAHKKIGHVRHVRLVKNKGA